MVKNTFTIRRLLILPFILLAFAVVCLFGVVSCSDNDSSELSLIRMGYVIAVTYDYNGGTVDSATSRRIRLLPNSLVPAPKDYGNIRIPGRTGYTFRYFCVAMEDEDGNLLRDNDGNLIPGDVWDFETDRVGEEEDEITLVAQWWQNYSVEMHYGDNFSQTETINVQRDVDTGSPMRVPARSFTNFYESDTEQIAGHYADRELTQRLNVKSGYRFTDADFENSDDGLTVDLWIKTVSKSYTVINEANDFLGFTANWTGATQTENSYTYYINDDIDLSSWNSSSKVLFPREFTGEVIGNNHTISNYRMTAGSTSDQNDSYGIFKILGTGAKVHDITFENVTATFTLANAMRVREYRVGLFAGYVREGVTVSNVKVSGTLNYTVNAGYNGLLATDTELVGHAQNESEVAGVIGTEIVYNGSSVVESSDAGYLVYVRYSLENGSIVWGDVYGLASIERADDNSISSVSAITVTNSEKTDDNTFVITSRRGTTTTLYTVTTSVNNGTFSATVTSSTAE